MAPLLPANVKVDPEQHKRPKKNCEERRNDLPQRVEVAQVPLVRRDHETDYEVDKANESDPHGHAGSR